MIRRFLYAGLALLCCLGFSSLGRCTCFAGEYILDENYSSSVEGSDSGVDWSYIPEDMTFDEWQEWDPTVGELCEMASSSDLSGPSLSSSYPDVYDGSISSTQLSYFTGIIRRFSPRLKYVLFRQSRYLYRLVYSDDMIYQDGCFSSLSGVDSHVLYVLYNTENNTVSDGEEGNFSLTPLSYPVYTNLDSKYPELERGIQNEIKTIMFMLAVMWISRIVSSFFVNGCYRW